MALCTDSLSADDFLPAMASVLPRAALRRLASDVSSVTNFSWREDFEDMWLFHFVASIGLMAQLASTCPASPAAASRAASRAGDEPPLLLAPQGSAVGGGEAGEEAEAWEDVSSFEPPPPTDDAAAPPPDAHPEPRARGRGPTHLSTPTLALALTPALALAPGLTLALARALGLALAPALTFTLPLTPTLGAASP